MLEVRSFSQSRLDKSEVTEKRQRSPFVPLTDIDRPCRPTPNDLASLKKS
jgi:hypothetical protein